MDESISPKLRYCIPWLLGAPFRVLLRLHEVRERISARTGFSVWWNKGYTHEELRKDPFGWEEVLARRRLFWGGLTIACAALLLLVWGVLAWFPKQHPVGFELRGKRFGEPPSPDLRLTSTAETGILAYERPADRLYLGRVPLDSIRYYFDLDNRLLRRIVLRAEGLRYGEGAFDVISGALAVKTGGSDGSDRTRIDLDPKKAVFTVLSRRSLGREGVTIELREECGSVSRFSELNADTRCDLTLLIQDSSWAEREENGAAARARQESAVLGSKDL